jgi:hypothetical protein
MADSAAVALTGTIVLGALAYKGIDLVKYASVSIFGPIPVGEKDDPDKKNEVEDQQVTQRARREALNGLISLVGGCVVGVGIVFLFALSQLADQVTIGDLAMGRMSFWSRIMVGLALTALAALMFDGKKALDNTDSASKVKVTLPSERARQARLGLTPERTTPPEAKPTELVTKKGAIDPRGYDSRDVAWMHDEFDKMIDRMFGTRTTP